MLCIHGQFHRMIHSDNDLHRDHMRCTPALYTCDVHLLFSVYISVGGTLSLALYVTFQFCLSFEPKNRTAQSQQGDTGTGECDTSGSDGDASGDDNRIT